MAASRTHQPLVVINVVGLTRDMIGDNTPHIKSLLHDGFGRSMQAVLPAGACSVQASMLTGELPSSHGIVANGWYDRYSTPLTFHRTKHWQR